jgi:hypothetical protein
MFKLFSRTRSVPALLVNSNLKSENIIREGLNHIFGNGEQPTGIAPPPPPSPPEDSDWHGFPSHGSQTPKPLQPIAPSALNRVLESKSISGEDKVRSIVEYLTRKPFPQTFPPWLRSPLTNRLLQLDMYNAELRLALENDGSQHSFFNPFFHSTWSTFENAKLIDGVKDQICQSYDVHLVRIPFWAHGRGNLFGFVRGKLVEAGYINVDDSVNDWKMARRLNATTTITKAVTREGGESPSKDISHVGTVTSEFIPPPHI